MQSFEVEALDHEIAQHPSLITAQDQQFTTAEALEQEIQIRQRWMKGQGKATPLQNDPELEATTLNPGQAEAVYRTLTSTDTHQIIHGLSGVGKTKALGELARQLEVTEVQVRGFSPTIDAAAQLQKELGIQTNTVEHLVLSKPKLAPNQLWVIDEAGMMSARQMQAIQFKAEEVGARLLLVGDKGQNSSVEAGSPLRSLINHGATTHSIREIIRQQNSIQKQAVELIADGNGSAALELLNDNGYITELASRKDRASAITGAYLALSQKERNQTLIVTGTNAERLSITKTIRAGLKAEGQLGESVKAVQLVSRQFTDEQSRRVENYQVGDYIKLHRDYHTASLHKGQLYKVEERKGDELLVSSYGGRLYRFNPSQYKDKEVFHAQSIEIAVGDQLRWTTTDKQQGRINGKHFTVSALEGTTMTIKDDKGHSQEVSLLQPLAVDYSLVSTSYRAQSKSQKRVIVSATSDPTSAREPFYVKISRQTKELSVYTQDLQKLKGWVKQSNAQQNPLELLGDNHEKRNQSNPNTFRHPGTAYPDGGADLRSGLQVQRDTFNYAGAAERLFAGLSRVAVEETIRGLRAVVEGLNRLNQQLHQGATNRSNLTREIRRLSEPTSSIDQAVSRATEQQLTGAIRQGQISEAIEQPLLGLRTALTQAKSIKPVDNKPLVELVATLQQTVRQIEQRTTRIISDEKLNMLAEAINHWKADSAVTADLRVQKVADGVNALHADQASAEVLRTQRVADSTDQKRAEDYIYATLQGFNQAVSKGMGSLRAGSGQLETTLRELQSILGNQEGIGEQLRKVAMDAQRIGLSPTPKPHKSEVFWQPEYPQNPPPNINQQHWEQFKSSAIHPDLIELNAQSISDVQVYERLLSEKLAKMGSGQYVTAQMAREMKKYEQMAEGGWWGGAGVDALSLINLKPGEKPTLSTWGCYKPDSPRIDQQKTQSKGKTEVRKYENPAGSSRVPFLPQVPDEIAERIYQKHGINPTDAERQSGFWFVVKQYSQIPITITEGFKKNLSSLSQGEVTIGLTGTNHIYRANDSEGNKLPQRLLNEQIAVFAQSGREFRFAYDQDAKATTVRNVRRDMVRGIELLEARGCDCKVVQWKPEDGKGLDDLIANQGPQAYSSAQRNAIDSNRDKRTHYRTEYNAIARKVCSELGNTSAERLDLEVYIRALQKGEESDGARFVGESDTARSLRAARRSLRKQKPATAEHYVKAISSVAGTYKRLSERDVEDLDELMRRAVQRQAAALELEDEKFINLGNAYGKRPRTGPGL